MNYSVLMAVYAGDNPEYLGQAIESMINQTIATNDFVIVKDGIISDDLQKVIDVFSKKTNIITQIQLEKNVGLGLALNEGLKFCKNELIARMDADDISLPDRCEKEMNMFKEYPELDIVGSPILEFDGDINNIVGERKVPIDNESIHKYYKRRDPFNHPSVMYRKSKVIKYGPYANYRKNQDTDLWIKMLSNGCIGMNYSKPLLMFRFSSDTYQKRKSITSTKTLLDIRKKAWMNGACSLIDYLLVLGAQMAVYIMPEKFQRIFYRKILRRDEHRTEN